MSYDPFSGMVEGDKQDIVKTDIPVEVPKYNRGMYRVHMRIYDKGVLHHRTIRTNDLGITVKTDVGDFELNTNWLFKQKMNILLFLLSRIKGIRQEFVGLYEKGNTEPFKFSLAYPQVSGGHLNTIRQSNALMDALKSIYAEKFDTRMLIIILVVVGMMGVYVLYSMGYLNLDSLKGLIGR